MKLLLVSSTPLGFWLANAIGEGFDWLELIKASAITGVCFYVLVRLEPRLWDLQRSIFSLSKTIALMLAEMPHVIDAVKKQALELAKEAESNEERSRKGQ